MVTGDNMLDKSSFDDTIAEPESVSGDFTACREILSGDLEAQSFVVIGEMVLDSSSLGSSIIGPNTLSDGFCSIKLSWYLVVTIAEDSSDSWFLCLLKQHDFFPSESPSSGLSSLARPLSADSVGDVCDSGKSRARSLISIGMTSEGSFSGDSGTCCGITTGELTLDPLESDERIVAKSVSIPLVGIRFAAADLIFRNLIDEELLPPMDLNMALHNFASAEWILRILISEDSVILTPFSSLASTNRRSDRILREVIDLMGSLV